MEHIVAAKTEFSQQGPEFLKHVFSQHHSAFPDLQHTVDLQIAEGDLVMTRVTVRGTHLGDWMGLPPTGKQVTWTETHIDRIVNGKSVEHWSNADDLGRLQHLGVIPPMGQAS